MERRVSILVLMDVTLQHNNFKRITGKVMVSILVLMDVTLQPFVSTILIYLIFYVSILVLMDVTLQPKMFFYIFITFLFQSLF